MPQGYSIHIGLNHVDTSAPDYQGLIVAELYGCINDANSMEQLATGLGFSVAEKLIDDQATASNVLGAISNAANNLQPDDILLLTYSGHGSQVTDQNGDESDGMDETWVLYDRMLVDDEWAQEWASFRSGVRIFMISDSCHSGTVDRNFYDPRMVRALQTRGITRPRTLRRLEGSARTVAEQNLIALHPGVLRLPVVRDADIGASIILISGCQDNQVSQDGDSNGLFTENLLRVWEDGFVGDYAAFASAIGTRMAMPTQSPNYDTAGWPNTNFAVQRPFTIDAASSSTETTTQPGTGQPSITAPAQMSRSDSPPTFEVQTGSYSYFFFEAATDSSLFGNSGAGTTDTWYATWADPDCPARFTGSSFQLSQTAWDSLKQAERIYYRIGTTATQDSYDDWVPSTYDGDAFPAIELSGMADEPDRDLAGAGSETVGWSG